MLLLFHLAFYWKSREKNFFWFFEMATRQKEAETVRCAAVATWSRNANLTSAMDQMGCAFDHQRWCPCLRFAIILTFLREKQSWWMSGGKIGKTQQRRRNKKWIFLGVDATESWRAVGVESEWCTGGEEARCVIDGCKFPCMRVKSRKGGETEKERERERESKDFYDQRLWR